MQIQFGTLHVSWVWTSSTSIKPLYVSVRTHVTVNTSKCSQPVANLGNCVKQKHVHYQSASEKSKLIRETVTTTTCGDGNRFWKLETTSRSGVFKVWEGEPPPENMRTVAPISIAIIIIVVVAIMQGYSIAFQRGPVREHVIKCSVFAVYLPLVSSLCVCLNLSC